MLLFNGLASFTHIAGKETVMNVPPLVVGFYRFLLGALAMWLLMKFQGRTITLEPADRWRFFTLAFLAVPVNQLSFLIGIQQTPASHPALLYATTPAWVLLFAVWLGVERLRWWKWWGIGLSMLGVFALMGGEILSFQLETGLGDGILVIAVVSWSLYTVLGKPMVERYGALETTFVVMMLGALMYLPFGSYLAAKADYSRAHLSVWLGILYMGLVTSGVAYYLWYWLLERIRPSQVAVVACAQPPTTAAFSWLIFGTVPTTNLVVSGVLILAGIVLMVAYGGSKQSLGREARGERET